MLHLPQKYEGGGDANGEGRGFTAVGCIKMWGVIMSGKEAFKIPDVQQKKQTVLNANCPHSFST